MLASMYTYGTSTRADKVMWDTREIRPSWSGVTQTIQAYVFNHVSFYEFYRNETAKMLTRVSSQTSNLLWGVKEAMKSLYNSYLNGESSEEEFKGNMERLYNHAQKLASLDQVNAD